MKKLYSFFFFIIVACLNIYAQTWSPVGSGMNQIVGSFAVYNNELYVGGDFTSAGGFPVDHIAKWNGSSWSAVGGGLTGGIGGGGVLTGAVTALAVYNNELYAGGSFITAGSFAASHIAKWNGSTWSAVGSGIGGGFVWSLAVYNNELYAGGDFTMAGGVPTYHIAKWNGSSWSAVGGGLNGGSGGIVTMTTYQGELYAGGWFLSAGGVFSPQIAKWNGSVWSVVGGPDDGVFALEVYNNELYAAGWFTSVGNNIAKWNGTSWSGVGGGVNDGNGEVFALAVYNNELYVGGGFQVAGGVPAINIAKWNGSSWSAVGSGLNNEVSELAVYNGALYAGGFFTMAGSIPANYIARWSNCNAPQPESIAGNTSVCSNSTQAYSVSPVSGATSYTWSLPSGWAGSSTTNSIATTAGVNSGNVSVNANNNCGQSVAQALQVIVDSVPSQPGVITGNVTVEVGQISNYSIGTINNATGYIWTLDGGGSIISGQNTTSVSVKWLTTGNYKLSVNAKNNCGTGSSRILNFTVIKPDDPFEIKVIPNPSFGEIYLKAKGVTNKKIRVEIINSLGQVIYRNQYTAGANDFSQLIDLNKVAAGIYDLRIFIDEKRYVIPIIRIN